MKSKSRALRLTEARGGLSNRIKAYSLIGITAVTVAGSVAYVTSNPSPETYANHCSVRNIPESGLYFLIDLTDGSSLTAAQIEKVKAEIRSGADSLRDGDRIDIEILAARHDGDAAILQPLFAACRPRAPENATLAQGKRVLEGQVQRDWTNRLAEVLDELGKRKPIRASTSPLIDSIKSMRAAMHSRTKRFHLVSDMLESSAVLSAYRPIPPFEELRSQRLDIVLVDGLLADVDVDVHQIVASIKVPHQVRIQPFWDEWFARTAGRVTWRRI